MTKDLETIRTLAWNWGTVEGQLVKDCPPEARVITGRMIADGQYHYFEQASGVRLLIEDHGIPETLVGYEILDEQKFMWFKLRWL